MLKMQTLKANSKHSLKHLSKEVSIAAKQILLIDDEMTVREVVQLCLEDIGGWKVLAVASGKEGLEQAVTQQPDAIVLDICMPEMDGLTFLQQLKTNSITSSIPVVFLSAKAHWYNSQQLQKLGVAGAIAKPFNPLVLHHQITAILGESF